MSDYNNKKFIYLVEHLEINKSSLDEYPVGSSGSMTPALWEKIVSFGVDFSAILTIKFAMTVCYAAFIEQYLFVLNYQQKSQLSMMNMSFHVSILLLVYYTYFLFCNYSNNGKTLGKMLMKQTTINDQFIFDKNEMSHEMDLRQSSRRALGYLLCYLSFGTFFIFSFFSEDKRGLQDFFSGTRTVNDKWIHAQKEQKLYQAEVIEIDIMSLDRAA